ncbi:MAG: hypothetical protein HRU36_04585 [Rickettsiales bacterium]|nr:hypothetical protein [Rickettsiales bacterium]
MRLFSIIETIVKQISAKQHYNKRQMYKKHHAFPELSDYKEGYNQLMVEKIILQMPEEDFCKIVAVQDCEVSKYSACICTKVMVFGDNEQQGKICDRFTTRVTSRNCYDGNLELVQGQCETSFQAGSCDNILSWQEEIAELKKENEKLRGELKEIYQELDIPVDF